jgi:hypothetical protein
VEVLHQTAAVPPAAATAAPHRSVRAASARGSGESLRRCSSRNTAPSARLARGFRRRPALPPDPFRTLLCLLAAASFVSRAGAAQLVTIVSALAPSKLNSLFSMSGASTRERRRTERSAGYANPTSAYRHAISTVAKAMIGNRMTHPLNNRVCQRWFAVAMVPAVLIGIAVFRFAHNEPQCDRS